MMSESVEVLCQANRYKQLQFRDQFSDISVCAVFYKFD